MTAITAITAQNTCGVSGIHAVPPAMLAAQIDAVASDIGIDAVKIGMLHDPEVVEVVADAICRYRGAPYLGWQFRWSSDVQSCKSKAGNGCSRQIALHCKTSR